jgi:putative MATE family efflux protein
MSSSQINSSQAVFVQGSILRHILIMSSTSTVGLLSIFTVDLLDMYFLSLLGDNKIVAAVGFSSTLLFLLFSMCIGIQIGMGALVSRAEGMHMRGAAGRYCSNVWIFSFSMMLILSTIVWFMLPSLLQFIGAKGEVLKYALQYSHIMLPTILIVSISMTGGGALRAIGDAKRSMYCTLAGGGVNAVLDPIFIFVFDWGLEGAAWASVAARFAVLIIAMHALFFHHKLPKPTSLKYFLEDIPKILRVAAPAMITNLMTPIGGAFVLKIVAVYGANAVAAYAVLGRIIPVAFGALFALSGAIGPIVGQNAGAKQYDRVREALLKSLQVISLYVCFIWLVLYALNGVIIDTFSLEGEGVVVFQTYCTYLVGFFIFAGLLFIANAAFNNLNRAHWSMTFNICRTFLGTIPLAYLLSQHFGLVGLMFGDVSGAIIFGSIAFLLALKLVKRLEQDNLKQEHLKQDHLKQA